jgi:thiamine biosynthesis lipoprotein ApbE
MVGLPFLVAQLVQMIREDEDDAKKIDAELDAAEAEATAKAAVASDESGVTAVAAAPARPWWEADPRFAERFESVTPPDQDPGQ